MEYYDCSTAISYPIKQKSSSFYKINGVYNTITFNYWDTVEATDEVETTDTTGIKTQTVGYFINNKKQVQQRVEIQNNQQMEILLLNIYLLLLVVVVNVYLLFV